MTSMLEATDSKPGSLSAIDIVEQYEDCSVAEHPLFVRLRTEPVNLGALWVLVANMNAGISPNFVRWLSLTIARLEDYRIASLIAKQLDDELGNGDFDRVHRVLLERFVAGLDPWRPRRIGRQELEAGRLLGKRASQVFESGETYEAIGGLIVAEIFAKQMDRCLGDEIRRQNEVPKDALLWLDIHEVLEVDHAEDSRGLAQLVPAEREAISATWQGARRLWDAMWGFLDDVSSAAFANGSA
jgi:pyrroloquinoline quinone (PQQ) biosynthesis protein C